MKINPLFQAVKDNTLSKLHPIVLKTCKTLEDYIACLDSNIPFYEVHKAADNSLQGYKIGTIFNRYENILIPEEGTTMWHLKEASQATSFYPLAEKGVVTGTYKCMVSKYPNVNFPVRQKEPDVLHNFRKGIFTFKDGASYDFKNTTGKTPMEGSNQILMGSYERYLDIMNIYEIKLFMAHNVRELYPIITELKLLAQQLDWNGQIFLLAANIHKFPIRSLPPLYTANKIHVDTFTVEMQARIIMSLRQLRALSKKAYELNIPEDVFSGSDLQKLLGNAPY